MAENEDRPPLPEKTRTKPQGGIPITQEEPKEVEEEKPSFYFQIFLGILGGIILTVLQATGEAEALRVIILFFMNAHILPTNTGNILLVILRLLVVGGGLTVIAGSLLLNSKLRIIGIRLISIGAGISLISLILRIITFGPRIQGFYLQFLSLREFRFLYSAFTLLGSSFGLLGVGVLLAFLATFKELKWSTVIAGISFSALLSGLGADPVSLQFIRNLMDVFNFSPSQIQVLIGVLGVYGAIILIVAVIYGLGWQLIAKIMLLIASFLAIASISVILLSLPNLIRTYGVTSYIVIIGIFRMLGMITIIAASIIVIRKG
ncbi:MAG: hypothetical protein GWO20_11905 [Candidatus Korarchaeota archaeon]|nr:hypothetical protein [Candidatus Korarchaeota archaeon]NIU84136.1 hypothetical protein [Candidatus Thorarchaeota archaeon]NIW14281.1 hypothetical protein [Candidatus Thorarchaeota archaeon]NIW52378.1 hypothetical protein [Candidatus Korarchaeota archaeon]